MSNSYKYYQIPPNLKYRYPAPGSCDLAKEDHPNLFKSHWKTPYRESEFNIRIKEKIITDEENTDNFTSPIQDYDPNDPDDKLLLLNQQPKWDEVKPMYDGPELGSEEACKELWAEFEKQP